MAKAKSSGLTKKQWGQAAGEAAGAAKKAGEESTPEHDDAGQGKRLGEQLQGGGAGKHLKPAGKLASRRAHRNGRS